MHQWEDLTFLAASFTNSSHGVTTPTKRAPAHRKWVKESEKGKAGGGKKGEGKKIWFM